MYGMNNSIIIVIIITFSIRNVSSYLIFDVTQPVSFYNPILNI